MHEFFAVVLVPVVLGRDVIVLHEGNASNEGLGGLPLNLDDPFFLFANKVVEFLDLTNEQRSKRLSGH